MKNKIKIIRNTDKTKKEFIESFHEEYFISKKEAGKYAKENISSKTCYILLVNDEMAGFFSYTYQYSHYANYLEDIFILKKFRGHGLSKILLDKYIEISKTQRTKNFVALSSTDSDNKISQKMHESYGFRKIGILKKLHYGNDEIFYAYNLK